MRNIKHDLLRYAGATALVLAVSGCAVYAEPHPGGGYYYSAPAQIPPGHLPPPGECRVWYPDRPPGHQPPPGPCDVLQYQVPPGAFLVQG